MRLPSSLRLLLIQFSRQRMRGGVTQMRVAWGLWGLLALGLCAGARAAAQPSPVTMWVAATIDGSTYRATGRRDLPDAAVQITLRSGVQITIPSARLAGLWPDSEAASLPPELILRTTCPRSQLLSPLVRDLVFAAPFEPPIRAQISAILPGQRIEYLRLDDKVVKSADWAALDQIRRPEGLLDICAVVDSPPLADEPWHRAPRKRRSGILIAGSILLPIGLTWVLVPTVLYATRGNQADSFVSIGLWGAGGLMSGLGLALLIPGLVGSRSAN